MNIDLNVTAMMVSYESDSFLFFFCYLAVYIDMNEKFCLRVFKLFH